MGIIRGLGRSRWSTKQLLTSSSTNKRRRTKGAYHPVTSRNQSSHQSSRRFYPASYHLTVYLLNPPDHMGAINALKFSVSSSLRSTLALFNSLFSPIRPNTPPRVSETSYGFCL